jgi:hypothetical protein
MTDAGMPMPALVLWMPMPTYGYLYNIYLSLIYSKYDINGQNRFFLIFARKMVPKSGRKEAEKYF